VVTVIAATALILATALLRPGRTAATRNALPSRGYSASIAVGQGIAATTISRSRFRNIRVRSTRATQLNT
jgi:hypothetical protein